MNSFGEGCKDSSCNRKEQMWQFEKCYARFLNLLGRKPQLYKDIGNEIIDNLLKNQKG